MSDFGTFLKVKEEDDCLILTTPYFNVIFRSTESMYCKSIYNTEIMNKLIGKDINNIYIKGKKGFVPFEDEVVIYKKDYAYPRGEVENIVIYAGRYELKIGVLGSLSVSIEAIKPS